MKKLLLILCLSVVLTSAFPQSAYNPVFIGSGGVPSSTTEVNPKDFGAIGDGASHTISSSDVTANTTKWLGRIQKVVTDGVTNGTTTITSATANFQPCDVGRRVSGTDIPTDDAIAGGLTWIASRTNSTTVVLNRAATGSHTGATFTFEGYAAGDEWDYVGLQEAFWKAFGGPYTSLTGAPSQGVLIHNNTNMKLNAPIHISAGFYRTNKTVYGIGMCGFSVYGDGKNAVRIQNTSTDTPIFYWDGASYGRMEGVSFLASASNIFAQMELDWTGIYSTLKTQQLTIADCAFFGGVTTRNGLRISRSGSAAQGDTILISNDYFGDFTFAGLTIGYPNSAFNALGIVVHGGDFQDCRPYGIYNFAGQVLVDGTSFQCLGSGPRDQIEGGADYAQASHPGSNSVLRNVRSESYVLCTGATIIENCDVHAPGYPAWQASHAYTAGTLIVPATTGADGRAFLCVKTGTSAGTEPTWANVPHSGWSPGGTSITSGSALPTYSVQPFEKATDLGSTAGVQVGDAFFIKGAGAAGADLFAHVTSITPLTLDTSAGTTKTNVLGRNAPVFTDGTAEWMEYNYYVVNFIASLYGGNISNCALPFGRIDIVGGTNPNNKLLIANNVFSRKDWSPVIHTYDGYGDSKHNVVTFNNQVLPMMFYSGNTASAWYSFAGTTWRSHFNLGGQPLVWRSGVGGGGDWTDVGIAPGTSNGWFSLVGTLRLATLIGYSSLPASPQEGMIVRIADAQTNTHGAIINSGGGTFHVVAYYNGTNWVVFYP